MRQDGYSSMDAQLAERARDYDYLRTPVQCRSLVASMSGFDTSISTHTLLNVNRRAQDDGHNTKGDDARRRLSLVLKAGIT